jgi:hypothetical protein
MPVDDAAVEQPKKRARHRPGRWLLLFILVCVALFLALDIDWSGPAPAPPTVLIEYDGYTWRVTPLKYLRAPGLEIEDVQPDENAALDYAIAGDLLVRPDHDADDQRTYVMRYRWSDDCNLLWSYLQAVQPALERAEVGLTKDGYVEPLEMTSGFLYELSLGSLASMRELARAFVCRGKWAEGSGRLEDALDDYLSSIRLGNHVARGPFLIQWLVAIAVDWMAFEPLERLVLSGPPVALLQKALVSVRSMRSGAPSLAHALRGERALCLNAVWAFGKLKFFSGTALVQSYGPVFGRSRTVRRLVRARVTRFFDEIEKAAKLTGRARSAAWRRIEKQRDKACSGWIGQGVALITPSTSRVFMHFANNEVRWRAIEVRIGLALYRVEHGRYPDTLEEIEPCLGEIPLDPYTEEPFHYRLEGGDYVFYSIGPDLVDNGGVDLRSDTTRLYGTGWWDGEDLVFTSKLDPPPSLDEHLGRRGGRVR